MSLKIGIVGLPNVGKSTLFQALTKKQVECANYAFCTIEPNVGIVPVPDERLEKLARVSKSEKTIPAVVEFVDIAGLVRDASKGEGLGNQFLANIRETDAIVHVVRCFEDKDVVHVHDQIDPENDIEVVSLELVYADLATVERRLESVMKQLKGGRSRELDIQKSALDKVKILLDQGRPVREVELGEDEAKVIKELQLLTMKPVIHILNVDEQQLSAGFSIDSIPEDSQLPVSVKIEAEIASLPEKDVRELMKEYGMVESGLDRLIRASYKLLGLQTFLTTGPKETRAWTVKQGATAPEAAGVIHTNFQENFIRAEVINYEDFIELGEVGAKEAGKMRLEGKEYVLREGDVIYFRAGA